MCQINKNRYIHEKWQQQNVHTDGEKHDINAVVQVALQITSYCYHCDRIMSEQLLHYCRFHVDQTREIRSSLLTGQGKISPSPQQKTQFNLEIKQEFSLIIRPEMQCFTS